VRDLLNFSRQAPLELKACDMNAVMSASLGLVEKQLTLNNINVTEEFNEHLPPVTVDENQMKQVFINILLNALQAMPHGGELVLRTSIKALADLPEEITRRAMGSFRPGETALLCEVKDTGVGIPKDKLGRVFDPFFTTKPAGQGTGLGLAITRSIIEKHRGLIAIESKEGHGATVTIALPIINGG
jgi:two-component system NtrC family sensor kinase